VTTSCIIILTRVHYRISWFTVDHIMFVLNCFSIATAYAKIKAFVKLEYLYTSSIVNSLQQNCMHVTYTHLLLRFLTKGN